MHYTSKVLRVVAVASVLAHSVTGLADARGDLELLLDADDRACVQGNCKYADSVARIDALLAQPAPDAERAYLLNTRAYIASKGADWPKTLEYARQSVAVDPGFAKGWFNVANALEVLGRNEEAANAYRRVAGGDELLRRVAQCQAIALSLDSTSPAAAIANLPSGSPADPRITRCLKYVASKLDERGHGTAAGAAYRRVAEATPTDPDPWVRSMYLYATTGALREAGLALADFNKRAMIAPPEYQKMYVHTLVSVASPWDAVRVLERYLAKDPGATWALENLAMMNTQAMNPAAAEPIYRKLLAGGGEREEAYREGLIMALRGQRKNADARAICETEPARRTKSLSIRWSCAEAFQSVERCDAALPIYRQIIEESPPKVWIESSVIGAGRCLEAANRMQEALDLYQLVPDSPKVEPRIRIVKSKLSSK